MSEMLEMCPERARVIRAILDAGHQIGDALADDPEASGQLMHFRESEVWQMLMTSALVRHAELQREDTSALSSYSRVFCSEERQSEESEESEESDDDDGTLAGYLRQEYDLSPLAANQLADVLVRVVDARKMLCAVQGVIHGPNGWTAIGDKHNSFGRTLESVLLPHWLRSETDKTKAKTKAKTWGGK